MRCILRCIVVLFALLSCTAAGAQSETAEPPATDITLKGLRALLEQMPKAADSEADVEAIESLASEIVKQGERFVAARSTRLADLNARLGELGPPPTSGAAENPDVTRQRAALESERNALHADVRLARVILVDAQQRRAEVLAQRRAVFEKQLLEHSDPPLRAAFWNEAAAQWRSDRVRLRALAGEFEAGVAAAFGTSPWAKFLLGTVAVLAVVVAAVRLAEGGLIRLASRVLPAGRLRRSLLALLTVLAYVVIARMAFGIAWEWLEDVGNWGTQSARLADSAVSFAAFLAFVLGLGRAMLTNGRSSWRLPPIDDDVALQLAPLPWLFAFVALVAWLPITLGDVLETPLNAVIGNLAPTATFAIACLVGLFLLRRPTPGPRGEAPSHDSHQGSDITGARPVRLALLMGVAATLLVALPILVVAGYLALARVIAGQATWAGIVVVSAYLLFMLADDLWTTLLSPRTRLGARLQKGLGVTPQLMGQAAALLSGLSRILVFFYMVIAFLAPLASGPGQLIHRSGTYGSGLKVGEFDLVPGAILRFLTVLVVGFFVLRVFKRWLKHSYLPHTDLEDGMRGSLTTLLGYVGGILVITFALSALGISVNRIAWIASALSVGIGFGLQAIVQNFISGLILLAERPVKVGDWVVLGGAEGDIRRINVRATEIQLGDRSTLIVPNSEFITKTIRNMTLRNAEGRVLIRLPMPLSTDAPLVRDVMLGALREHEAVLTEPAPAVSLDGVENGLLMFQATAYVLSPRTAAAVRSQLLFTILERLQAAHVPMSVAPTEVVATIGPNRAPASPTPSPTPPLTASE